MLVFEASIIVKPTAAALSVLPLPPSDRTWIEVYAPFEDKSVNVKDKFFNELNEIIAEIGNIREIIL